MEKRGRANGAEPSRTSHDARNNTLHMGVPNTHIHQSIFEATAEACNKIFVPMLGTGVHY